MKLHDLADQLRAHMLNEHGLPRYLVELEPDETILYLFNLCCGSRLATPEELSTLVASAGSFKEFLLSIGGCRHRRQGNP